MDSDPTNVAVEMEPVFLELGRSLFVCQAFEGTLVLLLSTMSHEEANTEEGAFAAAVELFSQKTLGHLLKRLREKLGPLPAALDEQFVDGWRNRNWIVHEFLHKCVEGLQHPKGRHWAAAELAAAKRKVKVADVAANDILDRYLEKYGLSVSSLKANADRLWDHLNPPATTPKH